MLDTVKQGANAYDVYPFDIAIVAKHGIDRSLAETLDCPALGCGRKQGAQRNMDRTT